MIEYIKLYNKLTGENDAEILNKIYKNFSNLEDFMDLEFGSLDIPDDMETTQSVSTNAKHSKKEIDDFLLNSSENEKLFYKLKEKIYNGDTLTAIYLKDFCANNKFDSKYISLITLHHYIHILYFIYLVIKSKDTNGQSLFHVAVDGMNNSAVQALIDLNIAIHLINSTDNYGMTPMHIAAINFDYEIFNMVSSLNPDLTIKDSENKTAIDYLKENEEIEEEIKNNLDNIKL